MFSLKQRSQILLTLLVAQLVCLAVGFVIQHAFLMALVGQSAEHHAFAELAKAADTLRADLGGLKFPKGAAQAHVSELIARSFMEHAPAAGVSAVLTDSDWQVLRVVPAAGLELGEGGWLGQAMVWKAPLAPGEGEGSPIAGPLTLGDRSYLASARTLPLAAGYVVLLRPTDDLPVTPSAIASVLPIAGLTAWGLTSVLSTLVAYMMLMRVRDLVAKRRVDAESESLRQIQSLVRTRDMMTFGLAKLAESRDPHIGRHLECVSAYASRLAAVARHDPRFRDHINAEFMDHLSISSVLHDIGKMAIEDSILFKPGSLDQAERQRMELHPGIGEVFLSEIESRVGTSPVLHMAREIARSHHERWDGRGYPDGLAGHAIPLAARIVAIADVYDALSTLRHYKPPFPHSRCVQIIRQNAGKQFDPHLVEIFLGVEDQFRCIAEHYGSSPLASAEHPCGVPSVEYQGFCGDTIQAGLNSGA